MTERASRIRAVVFDLDGVLIDTEGLQYQAWTAALSPLGVALSRDAYLDMAGRQSDLIAQELVASLRLPTTAPALLRDKTAALDRLLQSAPIELLPCALEAVAALGARMPLALATGGSRSETRLKLDRVGLSAHFAVVVTRSDVMRGKPHPDVYALAADRLAVAAQDCAAIEDTEYGVAASKAAGLLCIAVPGEYSMRQDFAHADSVASTLQDAVRMLGGERRPEHAADQADAADEARRSCE